jgi:hypothetical protein
LREHVDQTSNGTVLTFAERIAAARAKADAARALLSQADRDEIAARAEEAKALDEARVAAREARELALDRAADEARARYPHNVFETLDLEDKAPGAGAYVLRNPPNNAVADWQTRGSDATIDAKARDRINRNFAMESVVYWIETLEDGSLRTHVIDDEKDAAGALHLLWQGRAGLAATSITGVAIELGGFAAAKRKS